MSKNTKWETTVSPIAQDRAVRAQVAADLRRRVDRLAAQDLDALPIVHEMRDIVARLNAQTRRHA